MGSSKVEPMTAFPFIVGRGRSGTTMLRAIFDSHPRMAIPGESHFIVTMAARRRRYEGGEGFAEDLFLQDLARYPTLGLWELPEEAVREALHASAPATFPEAVRVVFATYAERQGKERYGEKTPINVLHMPLLSDLFPEARFIHITRDGRNVALSYLDADFGPDTVEEAAIYWRRFVRAGRAAGRRLGPARYREVRYEDLLEDAEAVIRSLAEFVDLEFDESMLRYFERADRVALTAPHPDSHQNLYLPPTAGLRDWRSQMSRRDVELFEALAGDLLSELGYERATGRPSAAIRLDALKGRARVEFQRVSHGTSKRVREATDGWRERAGLRASR